VIGDRSEKHALDYRRGLCGNADFPLRDSLGFADFRRETPCPIGSRGAGMRFRFGDHSLDTDRRELRRGGELVALEPQVFDLLVYLVQNRDRVVSKNDVLEGVWGGRIVSESALTSRLTAVRRAIDDTGGAQRLIRTVPRKGIRFIGVVHEEAAAAPASSGAPRLAIVVLPFVNLSSDPELEYFADGITDDLTTDLSRIAGSFVIACSTAFTYKGRATEVKQIGRELSVRYVLEGSVRRAGDRVQVNVQLIDADSGGHLWADRVETDRRDLAEGQREITGRLARTLNLELIEDIARRIEQENATDPDAKDLVMLGEAGHRRWLRSTGRDRTQSLREAQRCFERALAKDSGSIDARIGIARVLVSYLLFGWSTSGSTRRRTRGPIAARGDRGRSEPLHCLRMLGSASQAAEPLERIADRARERHRDRPKRRDCPSATRLDIVVSRRTRGRVSCWRRRFMAQPTRPQDQRGSFAPGLVPFAS
jgi:TolB-like protein